MKTKQIKKNIESNNNLLRNIINFKNEEVAYVDNRDQKHQNRYIIEVKQFIKQTMTTASANY